MSDMSMNTAQIASVTANEITIHYEVYGQGEPLLLLHGGTAALNSWADHIPALAAQFQVYALDTRAHGQTDNPSGEMSYRRFADDVAAFVRALDLKKPFVCGYSDGGQTALELGIHYSELFAGLVMGGTIHQFGEAYFGFLREMGMSAPGVIDLSAMDADWVEYLKAHHPRDNDPNYWQALMKQIAVLWWQVPTYTAADLARITAPSLILLGDRDNGIRIEQAVELYRLIPNSELGVIPDGTHGTAVRPLFTQMVIDFCLRHMPAATART